jgi:hypothetical protein
MRPTSGSPRADTYLYRAVDSAGETIDFMLSPKRDLTAAKLFLRLALSAGKGTGPRVINVDGHPAYARAIRELKEFRRTGAPLSLPNIAVSQEYHRAGPPIHQETNRRQSRIPVGGRSLENHRRLRGNACDSQRTDPLAGKGVMRWTNVKSSILCSASLRNTCLKRIAARVRLLPFATDPETATNL